MRRFFYGLFGAVHKCGVGYLTLQLCHFHFRFHADAAWELVRTQKDHGFFKILAFGEIYFKYPLVYALYHIYCSLNLRIILIFNRSIGKTDR